MIKLVISAATRFRLVAAVTFLKRLFSSLLQLGLINVALMSVSQAEPNPISIESRQVNQADSGANPSLANELDEANRQVGVGQSNGANDGNSNDLIAFRPPIEEEPTEPLSDNEMSYQMQLLQQEVQSLRGIVEKLSYELSRLQSTQDDRYIELDGRFQQINEQLVGGVRVGQGAADQSSGAASGDTDHLKQDVAAPLSQTDKRLYDTGLELIRGRQYDLAVTQLEALIAQYPESSLAANAYYWLGEIHITKPEPDYERARKSLAQVIQFFPKHRKVPDAAFKLGKVYNLMGDCKRAVELLEQVIEREDGKTVAKVAQTYLRDKVGECANP